MDKQTQPTILFFDSGVGGFSVYKETKQLLPNCHYLYCFDNEYFPYSEKTEEEIIQRTLSICHKINQDFPLDIIVIACNTASTVVLPVLREYFSIPIVGTVPAIKPAAEISETKHIGLLATKGTVKRAYVSDLIKNYASYCIVEKIGSTKLVEIAEQKLHGKSTDLITLKQELFAWQSIMDLDTIVLGCTHFPLIKEEIALCLPQVKYFMDSGKAIALRVKNLLSNAKVQSKISEKNLIFCTQKFNYDSQFENTINIWGFEELNILTVNE
ncbi:glutamate racemase [Pasteurella canis]|uniref:Glutamate racemase n=1 Tax=Pasteurella canis TaxID=753 RepID=A0A379ETN8_9PAST|nr:glutamate racemase [Pasteurella canis]SUC09346.1 glutamate racemase [Pasteurella canis]